MIRMMSDDPAAYRKFVEVLERLEDQEKAALGGPGLWVGAELATRNPVRPRIRLTR